MLKEISVSVLCNLIGSSIKWVCSTIYGPCGSGENDCSVEN